MDDLRGSRYADNVVLTPYVEWTVDRNFEESAEYAAAMDDRRRKGHR